MSNQDKNENNPEEEVEEVKDKVKDPKCEMVATQFLFNIIRDTDISKKVNHNEMKKKYLNGDISAEMLFDLANNNCKDDDIKKDISMYKHYALTCELPDESK